MVGVDSFKKFNFETCAQFYQQKRNVFKFNFSKRNIKSYFYIKYNPKKEMIIFGENSHIFKNKDSQNEEFIFT